MADDIDMISFPYDSSLPECVKIWLTRSVNLFYPNFAPKWPTTHPCWFELQRQLMANCKLMTP